MYNKITILAWTTPNEFITRLGYFSNRVNRSKTITGIASGGGGVS